MNKLPIPSHINPSNSKSRQLLIEEGIQEQEKTFHEAIFKVLVQLQHLSSRRHVTLEGAPHF